MGKESIIVQVDHSMGQIMENIKNDVTNAIDNNLREIKEDTKIIGDINDRAEEITKKLIGFDGLSSSLGKLKELEQDSKTLAEKITPLESQITQFVKAESTRLETKQTELHGKIEEIATCVTDIQKIAQSNEKQINELKESVEKIQVTLGIIVNLITPFWKKWGKKNN